MVAYGSAIERTIHVAEKESADLIAMTSHGGGGLTRVFYGSVFVIGEAGLTKALYDIGFSMNDTNPDYVVVGETRNFSYDRLERAVHLVRNGAKLIGTNPDLTDPTENGVVPATGALIAPIELATGSKAYFVGKPNPFFYTL